MPRPLKVDRPVHKRLAFPESLVARVDLMLYSELEGKVPYAAWSEYLCGLIRADLEKKATGTEPQA